MKTVVIGAGQSGAWVARTVREHMPDAEVALIGEEALAPYERPPLSKSILAGSESERRICYLLSRRNWLESTCGSVSGQLGSTGTAR